MNRTALLAAVGVAILGFVLLALYIRQFQDEVSGGKPVSVLVVTSDVAPGTPLDDTVIDRSVLPEAYVEEGRHIRADALAQILGIKTRVRLRAGNTLQWTDLTTEREETALSLRIEPGMRAMTIEAAMSSSQGGLLRPGDRVDVLLTGQKPGGTGKVTVPLLQNVLVVGVAGSTQADFERTPRSLVNTGRRVAVTVSVTIDQAALLAHADDRGVLRLVVRNPDDVVVVEDVPETVDTDLMEAERRAVRQRGPARLEQIR